MNTDIQNANPDNQTTNAETQIASETSSESTRASTEHRGHGKIARLPKATRDQINQMIDDGLSYPAIIAKLEASDPEFAKAGILEMNLSRWKQNGYQRYLEQQDRLVELRVNREAALEMVTDGDTTTLAEADLQIIASQYYDLLAEIQTPLIRQKITQEPLHYPRFLNAFARLTREMLKLKTYRDLRADLKERQPRLLDPKQQIADEQCAALATLFDRHFRMPHPDFVSPKPPADAAVEKVPAPNH